MSSNPEIRALVRCATKLKGARTNLRHVKTVDTWEIEKLIDRASNDVAAAVARLQK